MNKHHNQRFIVDQQEIEVNHFIDGSYADKLPEDVICPHHMHVIKARESNLTIVIKSWVDAGFPIRHSLEAGLNNIFMKGNT